MNANRYYNNSCSLGRYVYTFCGGFDSSIGYEPQSSIERLDAKSLLEGITMTWTLINPQCQGWSARYAVGVARVSETEIMLMGGI